MKNIGKEILAVLFTMYNKVKGLELEGLEYMSVYRHSYISLHGQIKVLFCGII